MCMIKKKSRTHVFFINVSVYDKLKHWPSIKTVLNNNLPTIND